MIVDGELVALNKAGQPDFGLLQRRMRVKRPTAALLRSTPVVYFGFDVLDIGGESVRHRPYDERWRILDELVLPDGRRVQVPADMTGVDGQTLMQIAAEHGIEGIVAKRADSIYSPGVRTKAMGKDADQNESGGNSVRVGFAGGRAGENLAALPLRAYGDDGELIYIGSVGKGFTD